MSFQTPEHQTMPSCLCEVPFLPSLSIKNILNRKEPLKGHTTYGTFSDCTRHFLDFSLLAFFSP